MSKARLKKLEQVIGRVNDIPIVVTLTDEGFYQYQGKLYTEKEINALNKKLLIITFEPNKYLDPENRISVDYEDIDIEGMSMNDKIEYVENYLKGARE